MRSVLVACAVACGGARPAPIVSPPAQHAPEVVAAPPDAAAPDAASDCVETSTVDGPKLAGARATIEICTTAAYQKPEGRNFFERRARLVWRGDVERDLGAWTEEHGEYGGTWEFHF